jgi:ABC-type nitrate/sulfonate/bicarbonate transport system permease component
VNARVLRRLTGPGLVLGVWELYARSGAVDANFLPPVSLIVKTFFQVLWSGERSSSANGAIAARHSAAIGWSISSSRVLSDWTISGPSGGVVTRGSNAWGS